MSKVAFVDSGKFSYPYDHCLLTELSRTDEMVFITSKYDYGDEFADTNYHEIKLFYLFSSILKRKFPKFKSVITLLKGIEHIVCSLFLIVYIKFKKFRIVHYQWTPVPSFDYYIFSILKKMGVKVFFTTHNILPHDTGNKYKKIYSKIYKNVSRLVVHSSETQRKLQADFDIPASKILEIKHGNFCYLNDLICGDLAIKERGYINFCKSNKKALKLVCFGLIRPYKGLHNAIEALAVLKEKRFDAVLSIIGKFADDEYEQLIRKLIKKLKLENDIFLLDEFIDDSKIAKLINESDLALFPYESIDQSGALLAMSSIGMPLMATNFKGFSDVIKEGYNGWLIDKDEISGKLIESLLSVSQENLVTYSENSMSIAVNQFSWRESALKLSEAYRESIL